MVIRLILLFTIVPLTELFLLIQIGRHLGALPTVTIVFMTGIAGGLLVRSQGLNIYRRLRADLQDGIIPTDGLFDGLFILIAGALLITPGIITDIFGFLILVPTFRKWLKEFLKGRIKQKLNAGQFQFYSSHNSTGRGEHDDL